MELLEDIIELKEDSLLTIKGDDDFMKELLTSKLKDINPARSIWMRLRWFKYQSIAHQTLSDIRTNKNTLRVAYVLFDNKAIFQYFHTMIQPYHLVNPQKAWRSSQKQLS